MKARIFLIGKPFDEDEPPDQEEDDVGPSGFHPEWHAGQGGGPAKAALEQATFAHQSAARDAIEVDLAPGPMCRPMGIHRSPVRLKRKHATSPKPKTVVRPSTVHPGFIVCAAPMGNRLWRGAEWRGAG